jgi:hypothetical protein
LPEKTAHLEKMGVTVQPDQRGREWHFVL